MLTPELRERIRRADDSQNTWVLHTPGEARLLQIDR